MFHTVLNNKKTITSDWLGEDVINLTDSTFNIPESYAYEVVEITERYIARPDLLSYDIYGDTLYTDLLCKLNGISNPFELNKGMLCIIPSPDVIMQFMKHVDMEYSDCAGSQDNTPKPKKKSEKRKANEAIVGSERFKIDKSRGIVIY